MAFFRWKFCADDSYNTLCVVPIDGLPDFDSEAAWCMNVTMNLNNSDACSDIQDAAQGLMQTYSYIYYNINGAIGVFYIILVSVVFLLVDGSNLLPCLIFILSALANSPPSAGYDHETSRAEKSRESYSRVAHPSHRGMLCCRFYNALLFIIGNWCLQYLAWCGYVCHHLLLSHSRNLGLYDLFLTNP